MYPYAFLNGQTCRSDFAIFAAQLYSGDLSIDYPKPELSSLEYSLLK
jgi:hypothetical protein